MSKNDLKNGGIEDVVVEIKGEGIYDALRWESSVHCMQWVPAMGANGRVHTSIVAVAVLPLMEETDGQNDELFLNGRDWDRSYVYLRCWWPGCF